MRKLEKAKGTIYQFIGIFSKYFKTSIRDKPMWFWVLGYPLLFMIIFTVGIKDSGTATFDIAFVSYDSEPIEGQLSGEEIDFAAEFIINLFSDTNNMTNLNDTFSSRYDLTQSEAELMIDEGELDGVIIFPQNFSETIFNKSMDVNPRVTIITDPDPTKKVIITSVIEKIINEIIINQEDINLVDINVVTSREQISIFDFLMPGLVIAGVTVAIMNIAQNMGIEKEMGQMQRLDTTPVPRIIQLIGNGSAQMIFTSIQILILMGCLFVFGVKFHPDANFFLAFLNAFILGFACVGIGLIIAAIVKNSSAAGGFAWVVILPLQFFGGTMSTMNVGLFNEFIPTYHSTNAIRKILVMGLGWAFVWEEMLISLGFGIVSLLIGMIIFSKKTQI